MYSSYDVFSRVLRPDPATPPDSGLFWLFFSTHIGTTFFVFYAYGYLVLPTLLTMLVEVGNRSKMLVRRRQLSRPERMQTFRDSVQSYGPRIAFVLGSSVLVYALFFLIDYSLYSYAATYVQTPPVYITRNVTLLQSVGLFGLFGSYSVFTFLFAFNISYVLTPLFLRAIRLSITWGVESTHKEEQNQVLVKSQLALLQNQINPHFLFNVFNNIYALIEPSNAQAARLLQSLSELLKYTIYETNEPFVDLAGELTFLKNYVEIEKSRQFDPERITFKVTGDRENLLIPPLLLVTFVENAFKHGLQKSYQEGWVNVVIHLDGERDTLRIQIDNYVTTNGTKRHPNLPPGGVGLINAQNRLNLLFDPGAYSLTVTETGSVYHVDLTIPLKRTISHVDELEPAFAD